MRRHVRGATRRPASFILGADFDKRASRLVGGRWWEFDELALFALKESRLPERTAPNPLSRQSIEHARERLADRLAPFSGEDRAIVLLEGVSIYLMPETLTALASAVRASLPNARPIADLMSAKFRRWFGSGLARELRRLGAQFAETDLHPVAAIEAAGTDFARHRRSSSAREAGTFPVPRWLLNTFLRTARNGYQLYAFDESRSSGAPAGAATQGR